LATYQFGQFSNLVYPVSQSFSVEKDISVRAGKYENIYLLETFYPASVYYSQQHINPLYSDNMAYQKMTSLLRSEDSAVFIINNFLRSDLERDQVPFKVLEENSSYLLVGNASI